MKAWITGAKGLIGNYLLQTSRLEAPNWSIIPITRMDFDLGDEAELDRRLELDQPDLVIHCAALSSSVLCEKEPDLAQLLNVETTRRLAKKLSDKRLILFSTDLVFNGNQGHYSEEDRPDPSGVYAHTKVQAEEIVLQNQKNVVLRTSINGGTSPSGLRGFNEAMVAQWREGQCLRLFVDEFRSPIHAEETARATWRLALKGTGGIFHLAGSERLSRWRIGGLLAERWSALKPKIQAVSRADYQGPPRPADTSLDCAKIQELLGFRISGLGAWLQSHPETLF